MMVVGCDGGGTTVLCKWVGNDDGVIHEHRRRRILIRPTLLYFGIPGNWKASDDEEKDGYDEEGKAG
jgi:hypothetical protein